MDIVNGYLFFKLKTKKITRTPEWFSMLKLTAITSYQVQKGLNFCQVVFFWGTDLMTLGTLTLLRWHELFQFSKT